MSYLEIREIEKSYIKTPVLKNISFSIPEKSITGIIGPNGAGKSTLFRVIAGFEFPDKGEVIINQKVLKNFNERKRYISFMPEELKLYPEYYVVEFLRFFNRANGFTDNELLEALSLKSVFHKKIKHLSKGWHQRLKLYTALSTKKPFIILDEPFDGFDPLQMKGIIEIIKKRNELGFSFILSIHQLADAQKICNYYILIDNGSIVTMGNLAELKERYNCEQDDLETIFLRALEK